MLVNDQCVDDTLKSLVSKGRIVNGMRSMQSNRNFALEKQFIIEVTNCTSVCKKFNNNIGRKNRSIR